ncbi:hypothetical protein [Curtobacterium sp. ISL-83]|uniref:hypothetical protein n=1 Tax=Curtobacterium sp. ISL-83 TaxID=2819145 RepID=UPI002034F27E|nr:hypothetical protein [Curtobacterium sp. ISL-83]
MDELINPTVVAALRGSLTRVAPTHELDALAAAPAALPGLRLRERVNLVRDALLADIPGGFATGKKIVLDLVDDPQFAGWMIWPVTEFVTARALESGTSADFDAAMALLARLTVGLTGEFAVRDLLIARPERGVQIMQTWTDHSNEHVRRLATEGSRAFLPWARRVPWLIAHPEATQGILDASYRDPAVYVRRSVANHLNDLSRIDADVVTRTATGWAAEPDANTPWVLRHGLRTLIKRADPVALGLTGYTGGHLRVFAPEVGSLIVNWGGELTFTTVITNDGDTDATVAIDYSIGFLRANGSANPKTFELGSRRLPPNATVVITKTHSFRPITTRTYYPGPHWLTVQANGVLSPRAAFNLDAKGGQSLDTRATIARLEAHG